ncbi:MAG: hypothetical protein GTO14_11640 [Anaerolineales bacterium]|nr:hypothetical protein [Anaerolineales bacterium]
MTVHVYLSPHLDDAVFACGGLIAQQVSSGDEVSILTICAGNPPSGDLTPFAHELHMRWGGEKEPVEVRRAEDREACDDLGASFQHLEVLEAIYRKTGDGGAYYPTEESIFGVLHEEDSNLVDRLVAELKSRVGPETRLYTPLAIGGHVDHILTRRAAEGLRRPLYYYQDMPYATRGFEISERLGYPQAKEVIFSLRKRDIERWVAASLRYRSQISTFWANNEALREEFAAHLRQVDGLRLLTTYGVPNPF